MTPIEFEQFIRGIDRMLEERGESIPIRPIAAIREAGVRLGCSLPIVAPHRELIAIARNYAGESLSAHIYQWMQRRYGARLTIDPTFGVCAVAIAGDAWLMRIPFIVGSATFNAGWHRDLIDAAPGTTALNVVEDGKLNVLNIVDGLTPAIAKEIAPEVAMSAVQTFIWAFTIFKAFALDHHNNGLAFNVCRDIRLSAMDSLEPYTRSRSKWHSLQAAEKALKFYITHRGGTYRWKHDIEELAESARNLGLPAIDPTTVNNASYNAGSRYEIDIVSAREALNAHHAALEICYSVASEVAISISSSARS